MVTEKINDYTDTLPIDYDDNYESEEYYFPSHINKGRAFSEYERAVYDYIKQYYGDLNKNNGIKKLYAYTQTITPVYNACKRHINQYYNTSPDITGLLSQSTEFLIVPEFTAEQRIHYHGILGIRDNIKWGKSTYFSLQHRGHIALRKLRSIKNWATYLIKDIEENAEILGDMNIYLTERVLPRPPRRETLNNINLCNNCLHKLIKDSKGNSAVASAG